MILSSKLWTNSQRKGFAIVVVLLAVGVSTAALMALQASAFRQAAAGREAVARLHAKWAARAGLEATIARLAAEVDAADRPTAWSEIDELVEVSSGNLDRASWTISSTLGGRVLEGPEDPHSKVNINRMTGDDLLQLSGMTEDVAAAIIDWIDQDDLVSEFGAETGFYNRADYPYQTRNGWIRSLEELELVAGVDPQALRGEDWNLNGRLDSNENDGDESWPPDNADGVLDGGWSDIITAESVDSGLAESGLTRLFLAQAAEDEVLARVEDLEPLQARAIIAYAQQDGATLPAFLAAPLNALAQTTGVFSQTELQGISPLDEDQITDLLNETTMSDPANGPVPGRVNLNFTSREILEYISLFRERPGLAEFLLSLRDQRPQGFVSLTDLLESLGSADLAQLAQFIDVRSHAYRVVSRGRDLATGIEVEISATIERSQLPIVITEMTTR